MTVYPSGAQVDTMCTYKKYIDTSYVCTSGERRQRARLPRGDHLVWRLANEKYRSQFIAFSPVRINGPLAIRTGKKNVYYVLCVTLSASPAVKGHNVRTAPTERAQTTRVE
jgi:hypothetical protein